jgi:hypothetical protein
MQQRLDSAGPVKVDDQAREVITSAYAAIRTQYSALMADAAASAQRQLDGEQADYKKQLSSIGDTGTMFDTVYKKQKTDADVVLTPVGTGIYSRSYRTFGEPSGNPLGLMAEPAKQLSPVAGSRSSINGVRRP